MRRLASRHTTGSVSRTANEITARQHRQQHQRTFSGVETMSTTQHVGRHPAAPSARVRDQARDAAALIVFSAATATCLAVAMLLLVRLGQQG